MQTINPLKIIPNLNPNVYKHYDSYICFNRNYKENFSDMKNSIFEIQFIKYLF